MSSYKRILYIGVTSDLAKRVYEHKNELVQGFSAKYKTKNLIYYETANSVISAIEREKQLKRWRRDKKEILISQRNPEWRDLYPQII